MNLPTETWRETLQHQMGLPEFLVSHLVHVALDHQDGIFDCQTDLVERITGEPPQDLDTFIGLHRDQVLAPRRGATSSGV